MCVKAEDDGNTPNWVGVWRCGVGWRGGGVGGYDFSCVLLLISERWIFMLNSIQLYMNCVKLQQQSSQAYCKLRIPTVIIKHFQRNFQQNLAQGRAAICHAYVSK